MRRGKRVNQIVIADAHLLFRRGLRTLLSAETDFEVVDETSNAEEAVLKLRALSPDVLIMDLALIEHDAQRLALALRQASPLVAMLFLTEQDRGQHFELAIGAGARGYMLRNSSSAQLVAGVRQVLVSDDQNRDGLSKIVPDLRALAESSDLAGSQTAPLTLREQEVMRLLAEGRTVREVAAELALSVKTIEAHKLNLMRKLDIHNRASLIEYATRRGMLETAAFAEPVLA